MNAPRSVRGLVPDPGMPRLSGAADPRRRSSRGGGVAQRKNHTHCGFLGGDFSAVDPQRDVSPITSKGTEGLANSSSAGASRLRKARSHFSFGSLLARGCRAGAVAGVSRLSLWRMVQDHDGNRESAWSAHSAEAYRPAESSGVRSLLESPPRMVLLPG